MARGASWDADLEERIGDAIGVELRAMGADLYGGVCVNVLRHPAWGRAQETYGEDPHHVGELGAALTRGAQRHVMACVKHFACNSMENARFSVDVTVDDTALHEVYLPHFRRIVEEGVACVMSAYNSVNGDWAGDSYSLLTEVLRDEWGFEGYVISDWFFGLRDAATSVRAGLDVEMPSPMIRRTGLRTALDDGSLAWADVDAAVTRTMAALLRYQTTPGPQSPVPPRSVLACDAHRALAREAAAKGVVLLRNEPVDGRPLLPLDADALSRIAVVGTLAAARNLGDGGSSDVWASTVVTPLDGLRAALPGATVDHTGDDPDAAAALAADADLVVVVVGYTRDDEGEFIGMLGTAHLGPLFPGPDDPDEVAAFTARVEAEGPPLQDPAAGAALGGFSEGGDRRSLRLRPEHEALILAVAAANPRTVVLVVCGSAVVMERWHRAVPAVAIPWYSGMEGGHGIADVLLGAVDATGRLPFSIPTDEAHLPEFDPDADAVTYDAFHGYWHLEREGHDASYPFGFGLSYTSWEIRETVIADDLVRVRVANTGGRVGATVVQAYVRRPGRPERRLAGFARVELPPGAEGWVDLHVAPRAHEVRAGGRWVRPDGDHPIEVGVSSYTASARTSEGDG
jgi:beta-glucosidase